MSAAKNALAIKLGEVIHSEDLAQWLSGAGDWIEVDAPDHGAAALVVWRMEDDGNRSPACEEFAHRLVASWNACAGIPVEVLEANAAGGLPYSVADQIEARGERAELLAALERARSVLAVAEGQFPAEFNARVRAVIAQCGAVLGKASRSPV